jgi:hypothetical protein
VVWLPLASLAFAVTLVPTSPEGVLDSCDRTVSPASHRIYGEVIPPEDALQGPSIMLGQQDPSVDQADGSVVFQRRDGVVTFARHGPSVAPMHLENRLGPLAGITDWGDLNGDGTPDYLMSSYDGTFVITGRLRPGVHDPAKVGARVIPPSDATSDVLPASPVGDQNGDGADDIAVDGRLYSMKQVMAKRPASATRLPRPFRSVSHLSVTPALQLQPTGPPALVEVFGAFGFDQSVDDPIEIVLVQGTSRTCLVTGNRDVSPLPDGADTHQIDARLVDGHHVVEITNSARDTPVTGYRWDLDA